jgi:hypothetical protein
MIRVHEAGNVGKSRMEVELRKCNLPSRKALTKADTSVMPMHAFVPSLSPPLPILGKLRRVSKNGARNEKLQLLPKSMQMRCDYNNQSADINMYTMQYMFMTCEPQFGI